MGYNLVVGNKVGGDVVSFKHPEAPAYGEPTDGQSIRWPSYSAWAEFTRQASLEELFAWETRNTSPMHLMPDHPGEAKVTKEHVALVRKAFRTYQKENPKAVPGFEDGQDGTLARLTWLKYWVEWCFKNCENPVFANT